MFDMGFQELLLIGVISLLVMGPERLPGAVRSATVWISRLRRSFQQIKSEIEREIDADELKRELHNQSIMQSLEQTQSSVNDSLEKAAANLKPDLDKLEYDIQDILEPGAGNAPAQQDDNHTDSDNHSKPRSNKDSSSS